MRIRVWIAITDGGDGEHLAKLYPSKAALIEAEGINDDGFDEYGYLVELEEEVINVNDFMVVED